MQDPPENPSRQAVLEELRRAALDTYGEERSAEAPLQAALELSATAVWRVAQELLEPLGPYPADQDEGPPPTALARDVGEKADG